MPGEDGADEVVAGVEDEVAGGDVEEAGEEEPGEAGALEVPVVETNKVVALFAPTRDALDE